MSAAWTTWFLQQTHHVCKEREEADVSNEGEVRFQEAAEDKARQHTHPATGEHSKWRPDAAQVVQCAELVCDKGHSKHRADGKVLFTK